jgi:hypothetical protein
MAERHPSMRAPVCEALVDVAVRQCALVDGDFDPSCAFEETDLFAAQEDAAFRVGPPGCKDVAVSCFHVLQGAMVQKLVAAVERSGALDGCPPHGGGGGWREAEARVFLLSCVAREACAVVKEAAAGAHLGSGGPSAAAAQIHALLRSLVLRLSPDPPVGAPAGSPRHPLLVRGLCLLVSSLAPWLQLASRRKEDAAVLPRALDFVAAALRSPVAQTAAARAVRQLCSRCKARLATPETVQRLSGALTGLSVGRAEGGGWSADGGPVAVERRVPVAEGIAVVLAVLSVGRAGPAFEAVCAPVLDRLAKAAGAESAARQGSAHAPPAARRASETALVAELSVFAHMVQFMESSRRGQSPLVPVLQRSWALFEHVASAFKDDAAVVAAVCLLYKNLFHAMQRGIAAQMPSMMNHLFAMYAAVARAECLDCVAVAVEFFSAGSADAQQAFGALLNALLSETFRRAKRADGTLRFGDPELLRALFALGHRFLLFCPAPLFARPDSPNPRMGQIAQPGTQGPGTQGRASPAVGPAPPQLLRLFQLGIACAQNQERQSTRDVLRFLELSLALSTKPLARFRPAVDAVVVQTECGAALCHALVLAMAGRSPKLLWPHVSDVLWAVVTRYPEPCRAWLFAALSSQELSSLCADAAREAAGGAPQAGARGGEALTPRAKEMFLTAVFQLAPLGPGSKRRFKSLVVDFCRVARRMSDVDALVAYHTPH